MTFNYNFYKTDEGRWFIDIPEWIGNLEDLEMVCGADTLLDQLSNGESKCNLSFSDKQITDALVVLLKIEDTPEIGGAVYEFGILMVWLCGVTEWVFGYMPNTIWVI